MPHRYTVTYKNELTEEFYADHGNSAAPFLYFHVAGDPEPVFAAHFDEVRSIRRHVETDQADTANRYEIHIHPGADKADVANEIVEAIRKYERNDTTTRA